MKRDCKWCGKPGASIRLSEGNITYIWACSFKCVAHWVVQ